MVDAASRSKDSITVRACAREDRGAIATLAHESIRWHAERWSVLNPPPDLVTLEDQFDRGWRRFEGDDSDFLWVAVADGVVIASLSASLVGPPQGGMERHDGPVVYISDLTVAPHARRTGAASRLMTRLEAWATERGAASMSLQMHAGNEAALALYTGLGYEQSFVRMRKDLPRTR